MKRLLFPIVLLALNLVYSEVKAQWTVLSTGTYSNLFLEDIYATADGDTLVAVGTDFSDNFRGHILFSYDGGNTWDTTKTNTGYLLKAIGFADNSTGVIAALGGVGCALRTTDRYTWTWNWCDQSKAGVYDIAFTDAGVGYMAGYGNVQFGDGNVYKTTDAGQTWSSISGVLPNMPFEFIEIADAQVLYGGSFLFGNAKLYRSIDGGQNWDSLDVSQSGCRDVHFHNAAEGILLGRDGVYRTTDSAQTWTRVGHFPVIQNPFYSSVDFVDSLHGFATAYDGNNDGHILHTSDGGLTWSREPYVVTNGNFVKTRAYERHAYAVTSQGTVMRSPKVNIGLNQQSLSRAEVFPNPAKESLRISWPLQMGQPEQVTVYSMQGKLMALEYSMANSNSLNLATENLNKGSYYVMLQFKEGISMRAKFIRH